MSGNVLKKVIGNIIFKKNHISSLSGSEAVILSDLGGAVTGKIWK